MRKFDIPNWLKISILVSFLGITFWVPTLLYLGEYLRSAPGPYVFIFDIPLMLKPEGYSKEFTVSGINYGRMMIQYIGWFGLAFVSIFIFSKKEQNNLPQNKKDSVEAAPPSLLLITFHLSANVDKVANMNYKEKFQRLVEAFEKEKSAHPIAPTIWIVETELPRHPIQYSGVLANLIGAEDQIIVVPLTHNHRRHLEKLIVENNIHKI